MFTLRDELALMAMKGKISETDKHYRLLMDLLNRSIEVLGDFSIIDFTKYLYIITTDKKIEAEVKNLVESLKNNKSQELSRITKSYFEVTNEVFYRNTRFLRTTLLPVLRLILFPFVYIIEKSKGEIPKENFVSTINRKTKSYDRIGRKLESLADACPAY
jgi:hypothetical protein